MITDVIIMVKLTVRFQPFSSKSGQRGSNKYLPPNLKDPLENLEIQYEGLLFTQKFLAIHLPIASFYIRFLVGAIVEEQSKCYP